MVDRARNITESDGEPGHLLEWRLEGRTSLIQMVQQ